MTELEELALAAAGDPAAREAVVKRHMGMVVSTASRYYARHMDRDDLVQEGCVGVVEAIGRFDPARGIKFITFAMFWVRSRVLKAICQGLRSNEERRAFFRARRAACDLTTAEAGSPTDEEVAAEIGVRVEALRAFRYATEAHRSPQEMWSEPDDDSLPRDARRISQLADHGERPDQAAERRSDERRRGRLVESALRRLDPRSREVVRRRYLREDGETLSSIGKSMGVSRERVRQIEEAALARIRPRLLELA